MISGICAKVMPNIKKDVCVNFYYKCNAHYSIYNKMMELTDGDHEISCDAASWCEIAAVGETYEFREGTIEIVDVD